MMAEAPARSAPMDGNASDGVSSEANKNAEGTVQDAGQGKDNGTDEIVHAEADAAGGKDSETNTSTAGDNAAVTDEDAIPTHTINAKSHAGTKADTTADTNGSAEHDSGSSADMPEDTAMDEAEDVKPSLKQLRAASSVHSDSSVEAIPTWEEREEVRMARLATLTKDDDPQVVAIRKLYDALQGIGARFTCRSLMPIEAVSLDYD